MKRVIFVFVLLSILSNISLVSSQESGSPLGITNTEEVTKIVPSTIVNSNTQTEIAKPGILTAFKNNVVKFTTGVLEQIKYVAGKMFDAITSPRSGSSSSGSSSSSSSKGEAYNQLQGISSGGW